MADVGERMRVRRKVLNERKYFLWTYAILLWIQDLLLEISDSALQSLQTLANFGDGQYMNILSAPDPVSALQLGLSQQVVEPRSNLTAWLGCWSIARSTPQLAESWWLTTWGKISWGAPPCPVHLSGSRCRWLCRYAEISRWRPMCTFKDKGLYTCRLFWINRLWFILFLGSIGTR